LVAVTVSSPVTLKDGVRITDDSHDDNDMTEEEARRLTVLKARHPQLLTIARSTPDMPATPRFTPSW
jgi:hypothetical protein